MLGVIVYERKEGNFPLFNTHELAFFGQSAIINAIYVEYQLSRVDVGSLLKIPVCPFLDF